MLLKPKDHYSQRNNPTVYDNNITLVGGVQCMPTARVMTYISAGIKYNNPSNLPDDAYFASLLISDEAIEFARVKYPWAFKDGKCIISPNEIHGMYGSWLDEKVTGKRRTDFRTDLTFHDFVEQVSDFKKPVMTSGKYEGIDGHATVFVGYDRKTRELRNADPFGNPHENYVDGISGYDVRYTEEYFNDHIKMWGHIFI
jgi:hypothetical protein